MKCGALSDKQYNFVLYGIPAFLPLMFNFVFFFDVDFSGFNNFFIGFVEVFRVADELKGSVEVLTLGTFFSFSHLVVMLPCMVARSKKVVFLGEDEGRKVKLMLFFFAFYLLFWFLFLSIVDFSSADGRIWLVLEFGFYFWPVFYGFYILPVYIFVFIFLALFNVEVK